MHARYSALRCDRLCNFACALLGLESTLHFLFERLLTALLLHGHVFRLFVSIHFWLIDETVVGVVVLPCFGPIQQIDYGNGAVFFLRFFFLGCNRRCCSSGVVPIAASCCAADRGPRNGAQPLDWSRMDENASPTKCTQTTDSCDDSIRQSAWHEK